MCIRDRVHIGDTVEFHFSPSAKAAVDRLENLGWEGCGGGVEITHRNTLRDVAAKEAIEHARRNPVSYTHLDVYKRQVYHSPRSRPCADRLEDMEPHPCHDKDNINRRGAVPVSYTHLGTFFVGDIAAVTLNGWISVPSGTYPMRIIKMTGSLNSDVTLDFQEATY